MSVFQPFGFQGPATAIISFRMGNRTYWRDAENPSCDLIAPGTFTDTNSTIMYARVNPNASFPCSLIGKTIYTDSGCSTPFSMTSSEARDKWIQLSLDNDVDYSFICTEGSAPNAVVRIIYNCATDTQLCP